jgi:hypothetical protein
LAKHHHIQNAPNEEFLTVVDACLHPLPQHPELGSNARPPTQLLVVAGAIVAALFATVVGDIAIESGQELVVKRSL